MDSPIPKPCCSGYGLALRRDESQRRVYEQVQGLGMVSFMAEHVQSGGRACEGRQRGLTFLIESVIINICQPPICQPQTPAKTGALGRFCS
jgi:hypothetical protein